MKFQGRGLGLRREFALELSSQPKRDDIDFLEVVPDNWMGVGGQSAEILDKLASMYPFVAHGLSLSIGDAQPPDYHYIHQVRDFLDRFRIDIYSDHLSLSRDSQGYLYELIPLPRSPAGAAYVADKAKTIQDRMGRQLVLENISYYVEEDGQMPEAEFLATVIEHSGCGVLLDVNNVYVNSRNHGTDAVGFLDTLPANAVVYYHFAGHLDQGDDEQVLDTHGTSVSDEVMALGAYAVARFGMRPVVLERDNHIPPLCELCQELGLLWRAMADHREAR